jgi:LysR family transcriptional regulator, flagellar master operon regulator
MDTELARTFLEVVSTGSFIRAAERLNVAQTTVSARIRILEERLGRSLFVRNKAGASLTPAGQQLLRYAPTFVQLWQRVRHQVAVPEGHSSVLAVGSEVALWQPLLLDWVLWMRRSAPQIALRIQVDVPPDLINQVANGLVDIAVMYAPPHKPGLTIDLLLEEKLVMVTTDRDGDVGASTKVVAVDWGPSFAAEYASSFPDAPSPELSVNLGPLALAYVLSAGGAGYFRRQAVEPHLATGELRLVPGMPQFSYPIYAVYATDLEAGLVGTALEGLRAVASVPSEQHGGPTV